MVLILKSDSDNRKYQRRPTLQSLANPAVSTEREGQNINASLEEANETITSCSPSLLKITGRVSDIAMQKTNKSYNK